MICVDRTGTPGTIYRNPDFRKGARLRKFCISFCLSL